MAMGLTIKNKLGFVDGSIGPPKEANLLVKSGSILRNRFSQSNGPQIFQVEQAIGSLSQSQVSVTDYYTKLQAMRQVVENYHQACLMQFLMGLNETFTQVRGQILLMDPMPHIDRVFSLLRQEERQTSIGQLNVPHVESTTLLYKIDKCYKIHGYPPGYRTKGKGPMANQVSHNTSGSNAMAVNEELSPFQLSQLQAQCQQLLAVLNTKPLLSNTPEAPNSNVTYQALANTASSSSLPIHSMSVFASNVKFPKAANENLWVIDTGATDHMAFTPWRMIGLGKLHNGLYLLQTSMDQSSSANLFPQISLSKSSTHSSNNISLPASVQCTNEQPTSMQLWHYRLGHSSFDRYDTSASPHFPKSPCDHPAPVSDPLDSLVQVPDTSCQSPAQPSDSPVSDLPTSLPSLPLRHSSRPKHTASYLQDYHCSLALLASRSLPKRWEAKKTAIYEARDLKVLSLDELFGSLMTYELEMNSKVEEEEVKPKKNFALKSSHHDHDNSEEESDEEEEIALMTRKFKKFLKKKKGFGRRFPKKGENKGESSKNETPTCYKCKKPGHYKNECPQVNKENMKYKKKALKATWDDSE
uniref:CCHC-type domain-containing protein n=1 Tax=Fagus sylvatica TaxID=28930 RepID=A0A2N9GAR1_FAGSY